MDGTEKNVERIWSQGQKQDAYRNDDHTDENKINPCYKNAVIWINALEGRQRCHSILLILLAAEVGTDQGKMVVNSLYKKIEGLPWIQKKAYLKQMRDKLKESSQIISSDAESVPGAIFYKAFLSKVTVIQVV